jgi:hypothetical protein
LIDLQAAAGNQAVSRLIAQRDGPTGPLFPGARPADPVANARRYFALNHPNADGTATVDDGTQNVVVPAEKVKVELADARAKKEGYFAAFLRDRTPLVDAVRAAGDDAARHDKLIALRDHDGPVLPELMAVRDALGGRWDIDGEAPRDAVLAAIQLAAESDAEAELDKARDEVRTRVRTDTGGGSGDEWCGEFAMEHLGKSSGRPVMDADFKKAFMSTTSLENFFAYKADKDLISRSPRWMVGDDGKWIEVKAYHAARGLPRQWQTGAEVRNGGFDIRAGDIAVLDVSGGGTSDHIVTVQSYDPVAGRMVTVGGNDWGMVPDDAPTHPEGAFAGESAAEAERRHHAEASTGRKLKKGVATSTAKDAGHVGVNVVDGTPGSYRIYGVGRPSLVDFEDHVYDAHDATDKPPVTPAPKAGSGVP